MTKPENEPLGGKPVLPVPSQAAQSRAHPLFSRIIAEQKVERIEEGQGRWQPQPHDEPTRVVNREVITHTLPERRIASFGDDEPTRTRSPFRPMYFASGRRYDSILATVQAMAGPLEQADEQPMFNPIASVRYGDMLESATIDNVDEDELARLDALAGSEPTHVTAPPDRPPPFAPMVRPSPPPRRGLAAVDEATLSSMVDTTMLIAQPDGTAAFEIAFDDDVFSNLACSISVTPAGVVATFRVSDVNTRRLLEAEAGRLRVRLSERGLKVAEVRVESD